MNWLVVASQTGARIYMLDQRGHLTLLKDLRNPLGRVKNKLMRNDKPGMNRSGFKSPGSHGMTGEKNPHEDVQDQFARKLGDYFYKQFLKKKFTKINIVAEPHLLGKLKRYTADFLKECVTWTAKDLEKIPVVRWPSILGFRRIPDVALKG